MKIEILSQLLADKSGGHAYVSGKREIKVVFQTSGKAYPYRGTVYSVAERLNLIPPSRNTVDESERVGALLCTGEKSVIGFGGCTDTLNHITLVDWLDADYRIVAVNGGKDEYDRELAIYLIERKPDWLIDL